FSVPFEHSNWATILDQLEARIKSMSSKTHGKGWKEEQQFCSEAATHFRLIKDAWRNHSMHVRASYSEEKAEEIFGSAKALMRHLATRLSEPSVEAQPS